MSRRPRRSCAPRWDRLGSGTRRPNPGRADRRSCPCLRRPTARRPRRSRARPNLSAPGSRPRTRAPAGRLWHGAGMRTIVLLALLGAVSACGGSATIHYDTKPALDCLQRTNSTFAHRTARSIFVLFASEDGMSAVEPVFVSFGPATVTGAVPAALGATSKQPTWRERRGDAHVRSEFPDGACERACDAAYHDAVAA